MKKNGTELTITHQRENGIPSPQRWWDISKETGHPVCKDISALNQFFFEVEYVLHTSTRIHRTQNSCFAQLIFVNPLSLHGAVSNWCEELPQRTPNQKELTVEKSVAKENEQVLKNVKPQDVNSLVQTPRSDNAASGNRCSIWKQIARTTSKV